MKIEVQKGYSRIPFIIGIGALAFLWYKTFITYDMLWDTFAHLLISKYLFTPEVPYSSVEPFLHIFTYPLFHIAVKIFHIITTLDYEVSCAIVLTAVNVISSIISLIIIEKISNKRNYLNDSFALFSGIFMTAAGPMTGGNIYALIFGPNPVHNPTLLFVRPFGLLFFLFFVLYIDCDESLKKQKIIYLILFGLLSILTAMAKPSFSIVLLPAMAIVTIMTMIQKKNIWVGVKIFLAVLPSLVLILVQQKIVSDVSVGLDISFIFGAGSGFNVFQLIGATLATFPVVFLLFDKNKTKQAYVITALLTLLVGWFQAYFIYNGPSADFSWGYDLAIHLATIVMLATSYKNNIWRRIAAYALYAYQVAVGFYYLYMIFQNGGEYWI